MTDTQKTVKEFVQRWTGKGYEKGESQRFWIDLLQNVLGVLDATEYIVFEEQVKLDHTAFIDGYIEATHVMIEQKSLGKDLRKGIKQSDGSVLSPYQQAVRYSSMLPYSKRPRWIVTCNFSEFLIYDMEKPNGEPEQIFLKDLPKEYYRLKFLVDTGNDNIRREMEISLQAGELVGKLYDLILKQYKNPDSPETLKSLNMLCVRLVFCLYAEDSGIFGSRKMFGNYLKQFSVKDVRKALIELFHVLDTRPENRDPYMNDDLSAFPYVNGGLFADENIEIPRFTEEIVNLLLNGASKTFNWSEISPTIFGAVFESTLNPDTRRSGGMHYTSIENIHKVIAPLFLNDLKSELEKILEIKVNKTRLSRLEDFRKKLSELTFLDPACGSGNFLTETYISLRRLENEALRSIYGGQKLFNLDNLIKVGIHQFYGIEINDFAVTVAKTALWIAESQMMHETEEIIEHDLDFLPLKSYANIIEGNSLRIDWADVVPKEKLSYIMGNPPFVANTGRVSAKESNSKGMQSAEQKKDREQLFGKNGGMLDYVACWIKKTSLFIKNTQIKAAFVSTDSITQGQQVEPLWKDLFDNGLHINFAHRSFKWKNETNSKGATVFVVIIGFSYIKTKSFIFNNGNKTEVENINAYLINAPDVIISKRSKPLCDVFPMCKGFQATDNGYLIMKKEEKNEVIKKEPEVSKWIRQYSMGEEFIHGTPRYCLWLAEISPREINNIKVIKDRVQKCKEWRCNATKTGDAYKLRGIPHLFRPCKQFKDAPYIAVPQVSSVMRKYIPMDFIHNGMIPGNNLFCIFNAELYHFGVLTSNVHMAWMKTVCGYFGPSYRYSSDIVYNNFPWCNPTPEQAERIEHTAKAILDARNLYPDCSLADLYDELTMPPELRKAHQANDFAVMSAYGFDRKITESECVAELMKIYQKLTK
ncbi:MAG: methylase [Ruminococcus sp.]|nr:methylase [Ruminococcus sp.]